MALRRTTILKTGNLLRRGGLLKKFGPRAKAWEKFRNAELVKDRDEEGIIKCQDYMIALPPCGIGIPSPDLHHIFGRDGKLFLDKRYMVWLTRECHEKAHNQTTKVEMDFRWNHEVDTKR